MADLIPYSPPDWASNLRCVPKFYVKLAQRQTPIHEWNLPEIKDGFKISIKRDDMTGSILAGNKVRKLEFLLADALAQKCDSVITGGRLQSNHCRVTSFASKLVGLKCHLLLRTSQAAEDQKNCSANVLLDRLSGSNIYLVPSEALVGGGLSTLIDCLAERLWKEKKEKAYRVPLGGTSPLGTFGYIEAFQEMISQGVLHNFDDIVVTLGSGGTVGGLAVANYLTGSRLKIHGVSVCGHDANHFYDRIDQFINDYGLKDVKARDICDVIDGYKGICYANSTDEEIEQLIEIAQSTGIVLDPVYTLKATRGMLKEMEVNPSRFKGKRILFLHTGDSYALYNGRINNLLITGEKTQNKDFVVWNDVNNNQL